MGVEVGPIQVADGPYRPMLDRITPNPGMLLGIETCPCHSKTEFERHVESGSTRRISVQFNSTEVMNGIPASLNQVKNALKPPSIARNAKRGAWYQSMGSEPHDVREIQIFKWLVVRDI
jgi:hypothetical protein